MSTILYTNKYFISIIFLFSYHILYVSSTKVLNYGLNHVLDGSDVSMTWNTNTPLSKITIQTIHNNIDSILVIQQDMKTKEYYVEISSRKMKVVSGYNNFTLILTDVNMNNSQTFKFDNKQYIIDVYERPRVISSSIENRSFNITLLSNPSPNVTWFLNDQSLDKISLKRNGSLHNYNGKIQQNYLCKSVIKLNAMLYDYQWTKVFPLPNDYQTYNESLKVNETCFTLEWQATVSSCNYTGYEIFYSLHKVDLSTVNFSLLNITKLPANQRSFNRCFNQSIEFVYVYFRTLYGSFPPDNFKEITNYRFKCGSEIVKTELPSFIHILAGVGSVITIMLCVCCLSHCVLLRKQREAMKGVPLKVNGETENETAIFLPTDEKSTPSPANEQDDVVIFQEPEKHEENINNDLKITINDNDNVFLDDGEVNADLEIKATNDLSTNEVVVENNLSDEAMTSSDGVSSPISSGDKAPLIPVSPCDDDQPDGKDITEGEVNDSATLAVTDKVDVKEDKPLIEIKENPTRNDAQQDIPDEID